MKKFLSCSLIVLAALTACKKNTFKATERTQPPADAALVKIAHLSATTNSFNVQIYVNNERVSYPLPYNTPFPGGGLGTGGSNNSDFLVLTGGKNTVSLNVPFPGTDVIQYKYYETQVSFQAGQRQTLFIADTGANITSWIVPVDGAKPDSGFAKIQFVNAIPNVPSLDLYKGATASTSTLVIGDVSYKGYKDYVQVPFGADSFFVRPAGAPATSTPIGRGRIVTANQRLYTFYGRGYNTITTGNRTPAVSAIINQ